MQLKKPCPPEIWETVSRNVSSLSLLTSVIFKKLDVAGFKLAELYHPFTKPYWVPSWCSLCSFWLTITAITLAGSDGPRSTLGTVIKTQSPICKSILQL